MASRYDKDYSATKTPQTEKAHRKQVRNSAGGYSFAVDKWGRVDRFLILGSSLGTYYVNRRQLVRENADAFIECLKEDGARAVSRIVEISTEGRAPSNEPALFALSLACSPTLADEKARKAAFEALPLVARTGTHLFTFIQYVKAQRGWGRGLRRAVASRWYNLSPEAKLEFQLIKYQQRNGWSHRDVLRLAHPKDMTPYRRALYAWATHPERANIEEGTIEIGHRVPQAKLKDGSVRPERVEEPTYIELPAQIAAFERAKRATSEQEIVRLVRDHDLPRECVPSQWLNSPAVWEALMVRMPLMAMVRNLGKMTSIGYLKPMSEAAKTVCKRLLDRNAIRGSRIHPVSLLIAARQYSQGHGARGKLSWSPVETVVDALDDAFYLAFKNVRPTGKRFFLGLDVSGSMSAKISQEIPLRACEASAAMAMVTARTEENYVIRGFSGGLKTLGITAKDKLREASDKALKSNFGGTDCALPMIDAKKQGIDVDCFIVYTDSETWHGRVHPYQALVNYRQKTGIDAKLIVVGMTSNGFSIANPDDAGMLDVVGFDASVPQMIRDFVL